MIIDSRFYRSSQCRQLLLHQSQQHLLTNSHSVKMRLQKIQQFDLKFKKCRAEYRNSGCYKPLS